MSSTDRVSVTRRIAAPASQLFEIVSNPAGHVEIDGSGMLEAAADAETDVTNYCDWTNISDELRSRRTWPIVPVHLLERAVENLQRIATKG